MPIHKLKLVHKKQAADNVIVFYFEKPEGFNFKPGQYGGFTLLNQTQKDPAGLTRRFSILSTPHDKELAIAIRMQNSPYKQALNAMQIGDEIKFAGPTGLFTLHEELNVPAVFIAGGIGITPFYCMIKHAERINFPQQIYLFYGNATIESSAFLQELQTLKHPNFKLIPTMANPDANWQGEQGFITETMIKKYLPDLSEPIYYVCGSPAMVTTLQELLAEMGIDEDKIKVEDFPGY